MIDVAKVKASVSMTTLLARDGHQVKKVGATSFCLCPFHSEKTPSCQVFTDHLFCHGCRSHEDVIDYMRRTRSLTFKEAIEALSGDTTPAVRLKPATIERPREEEPMLDFQKLWCDLWRKTNEEAVSTHGQSLGVNPECLWWLGIVRHEEKSAWAFPMRDGRGNMVGLRLRTEDGKKFAVTGSRQGLFIPSELSIDPRVFICEGPTDTAACLTIGFYAIGRPSCNGSVDHVLDFLKVNRSIREVVLVTDNDGPGIKGADELRCKLPIRSYQLLLPPKDIRRFVQIGGAREMIESMIRQQVPWRGNQ